MERITNTVLSFKFEREHLSHWGTQGSPLGMPQPMRVEAAQWLSAKNHKFSTRLSQSLHYPEWALVDRGPISEEWLQTTTVYLLTNML